MSHLENRQKTTKNISDIIQPLHQVFTKIISLSDHLTLVADYLENVGKGKIYKKMLTFVARICQILLIVISNL